MFEKVGNFWNELGDVHVITTNGNVKNNGACVMGRGVARQAKILFPSIDFDLGSKITRYGNIVFDLDNYVRKDGAIYHMFSFPVKHNWYDAADQKLIEKSFGELIDNTKKYNKIIIVRPGCGNGLLDWTLDVQPIAKKYLDDRFIVMSYK